MTKALSLNSMQLQIKDGLVLISYSTKVAAILKGKAYRTSTKWSNTTTRTINKWLNGRNAEEKEQSFFDTLAA